MGPACISGNTASLLPVNVFQLALKFFCSVILGQLESFRNYRGFSIIFSQKFPKVRIFLIPLCITFSVPKI